MKPNPLIGIIGIVLAFFLYMIGSIIVDTYHIQQLEKQRLELTNKKLRKELELIERKGE